MIQNLSFSLLFLVYFDIDKKKGMHTTRIDIWKEQISLLSKNIFITKFKTVLSTAFLFHLIDF